MTFKDLVEIVDRIEKSVIAAEFKEDYTYESTIEEDEYADVIISCPSGYSLNSEGTKCKKISNETTNPVCPTISGYTLYNQDGFTCKYKSNTTVSQVCPSLNGYTIISNQSSGWTCVYKKYLRQGQGLSVPQNTSTRIYEFVTTALIHDCDTCSYYSGVIYNIFARKTQSAVCPSGYTKIGNSCVKTKTNAATCPSGYEKINNTCKKVYYKSIIKSCPTGFTLTNETNQRCYKKVTSVITMHDVRDVTYYRYATREYINGTIDYKWSTSNNDKSLLNNGYKLTGRTRTKKGGK